MSSSLEQQGEASPNIQPSSLLELLLLILNHLPCFYAGITTLYLDTRGPPGSNHRPRNRSLVLGIISSGTVNIARFSLSSPKSFDNKGYYIYPVPQTIPVKPPHDSSSKPRHDSSSTPPVTSPTPPTPLRLSSPTTVDDEDNQHHHQRPRHSMSSLLQLSHRCLSQGPYHQKPGSRSPPTP